MPGIKGCSTLIINTPYPVTGGQINIYLNQLYAEFSKELSAEYTLKPCLLKMMI